MLKETGRVIAVETDAVWVETIQQSTCGSCAAKKGCGQSLLAKLSGKPAYLRVLLQGKKGYQVNDNVTIGIPDDVIVTGSLFVYFVPLLLMIVFAGIAHTYNIERQLTGELLPALAGIVGLFVGGAMVRLHAYYRRNDKRLQPVIIDISPSDKTVVMQPIIVS